MHPKYVFLAVLLFTILATIAFLMPGSSIPSVSISMPIGMDKLVHVGIHFTLVLSWLIYYARQNSKVKMRSVFFIALCCVAYGIIIEVVQGMTETRSSELFDVFANMIGTALGTLVFLVLKSRIKIKL